MFAKDVIAVPGLIKRESSMLRKKFVKIFLVCIAMFAAWRLPANFTSPKTPLLQMSELSGEEKSVLNKFFLQLFYDSAGYVFYGTKPMTLILFEKLQIFDGYKPKPLHEIGNSIGSTFDPANQVIVKGMSIWEKKFKGLQSDIVLRTCKNPRYKNTYYLLVINTKNFLRTIEENEVVFKQRLSHFSNSHDFFHACLASNNMLEDVLEKDEVLLGTLLGYGRLNAELFERSDTLMKDLKKYTKDDPDFNKLKEELDALECKLNALPQDYIYFSLDQTAEQFLQFLPLPFFVADLSSEETQQLLKSYEETRKKIQSFYVGKDFVEQTLAHLFIPK